MILIDGLYINKGGGAVLLEYLIEEIVKKNVVSQFHFLLDPRFKVPPSISGHYTTVANKMSARKAFYVRTKQDYSAVFCFANTPPPVKLRVPVYTYMHNQKLLEAPLRKFERMFWTQYLKYLVIKWFNRNTDYYIVQTPHMVAALCSINLKQPREILTIPFYDNSKYKQTGIPFEKRNTNSFVFVSNPSPQKNYPTLLAAWELLLARGLTPTLHVTIDNTGPQLIEQIKMLNSKGAQIINHDYVDPKELYATNQFLIFPSVMESFGLPLIEAADSGMKIIASDLPYVYDVVTPSLVFDTKVATSIADAVEKAMEQSEQLAVPTINTHNKINELIDLLLAHN